MSSVQEAAKEQPSIIGRPLKRMEDPRFITGKGRFTDDIVLPNMLHAAFVRSLHAHAKIKKVDVTAALASPGVRLVLTGQDLQKEVKMMQSVPPGNDDNKETHRLVLPLKEVNFAGEAVAMVVADDVYAAEDAAELVEVEYDPLPVVVDPVKAAEPGSPLVHDYHPDNVGFRSSRTSGKVDKAFKAADTVVRFEHEFPRLSATPLEPRNCIADFQESTSSLTVWLSTQSPHESRDEIAKTLRLAETKVRVIAPDIGGGFGQKGSVFPEHLAACYASMKLGKPVKWTEGRRDNLSASSHGRGQKQFIEAAVRKDGKILGLKVKVIADGGAYSDFAFSMVDMTLRMSPGVYDIGAFQGEALTAFTNKPPIGPYRGASRPEAAYLIERMIDVVARRLKLDPVKVRLKNYVPRTSFPFESAGGYTYDSGDYEGNLRKALELSKYEELRSFQRSARRQGRLVGIGVITYVEVCGFGPGYPQTAAISVSRDGEITMVLGTNPHGQGHWTPFAQIVAEVLGIDTSDVAVKYGDTNSLPSSTITAGSRSAAVGGTAVLIAAQHMRDKMSVVAGKLFGVPSGQIVFKDGKVRPSGSRGKGMSFAEVAEAAYDSSNSPRGTEPGLYEYYSYNPPANVFPFGTHIAMVEVDSGTGLVKILKYVAVDDVGKVLNPLIVEGQVQGGVLQGISQALLEGVVYDESGQLLTATLSDYLIPSTDTAPMIETYRTETPSPVNPLGLKGVGEAGAIAATPAIANAVEDAVSQFGAEITKLPLTPEYVKSLISRPRAA